jgi:hypothetical protein
VTITKSACAFSRVKPRLHHKKPYTSCEQWRENAIEKIKELRANIMFTSQSRYRDIPRETMAKGLRSVWTELTDAGVQVIAIRDTPRIPFRPETCLDCKTPRTKALQNDNFAYAAAPLRGVRVVDLTDEICGRETCDVVVGNIIVYRDPTHITATYAERLAPYLARKAGLPSATSNVNLDPTSHGQEAMHEARKRGSSSHPRPT